MVKLAKVQKGTRLFRARLRTALVHGSFVGDEAANLCLVCIYVHANWEPQPVSDTRFPVSKIMKGTSHERPVVQRGVDGREVCAPALGA